MSCLGTARGEPIAGNPFTLPLPHTVIHASYLSRVLAHHIPPSSQGWHWARGADSHAESCSTLCPPYLPPWVPTGHKLGMWLRQSTKCEL